MLLCTLQVLAVAASEGVGKRVANTLFESRCATSGIGLFRLLAKANHDCDPSCEVLVRSERQPC